MNTHMLYGTKMLEQEFAEENRNKFYGEFVKHNE